ncbi:hypothetical protein FACS189450_14030 [Spirochaetia bacterium]|nr:hypothetical protein FACS189450_14030 [Spirochaetia bacterium]
MVTCNNTEHTPEKLKGMEKNRDFVKAYLAGKGIDLIGRFGEWDYLWSDQGYMSGKDKANIIL